MTSIFYFSISLLVTHKLMSKRYYSTDIFFTNYRYYSCHVLTFYVNLIMIYLSRILMRMDIEIRLAKSEDSEDILELQANSLKILSSQDYNPRQIESLIRSQKSARFINEIIFVAEGNNRLVGFASLLVHTAQIGAMFVHPDFVRQGIGTRLITAIESAAIEKRYKTIYVVSSLSAVKFYQANGYEVIGQLGLWSDNKTWIPCSNMRKQLIPLTEREKWTRRITLFIIYLVILWVVLRLL